MLISPKRIVKRYQDLTKEEAVDVFFHLFINNFFSLDIQLFLLFKTYFLLKQKHNLHIILASSLYSCTCWCNGKRI